MQGSIQCKVYVDDTIEWLTYEWEFVLRNMGRWGDETPEGCTKYFEQEI